MESGSTHSAIRTSTTGVVYCVALIALACAVSAALAKEKVDLLVTNGVVVTMDASLRVIENGAVAVRGDSIIALGTMADLSAQFDATKVLDAHGGIVMPGLINTHAHAAMSLFEGSPTI